MRWRHWIPMRDVHTGYTRVCNQPRYRNRVQVRKWNSRRHRWTRGKDTEESYKREEEEREEGRKESSSGGVEVLKERKVEEGCSWMGARVRLAAASARTSLQYYSEGLSVKYRGENNKERMKKPHGVGGKETESFGKKNTRWARGKGWGEKRGGGIGYTSFDDAFLFSKQTREERTRAAAVPFGDRFISRIRISARIRIGEREWRSVSWPCTGRLFVCDRIGYGRR